MTGLHTPGPWFVGHKDPDGGPTDITYINAHFDEGDWWFIAEVCGGLAEREANARLIASAPELLSHLQFAVKLLGGFPGLGATTQVEAMRAAISKATSAPPLNAEADQASHAAQVPGDESRDDPTPSSTSRPGDSPKAVVGRGDSQ